MDRFNGDLFKILYKFTKQAKKKDSKILNTHWVIQSTFIEIKRLIGIVNQNASNSVACGVFISSRKSTIERYEISQCSFRIYYDPVIMNG